MYQNHLCMGKTQISGPAPREEIRSPGIGPRLCVMREFHRQFLWPASSGALDLPSLTSYLSEDFQATDEPVDTQPSFQEALERDTNIS